MAEIVKPKVQVMALDKLGELEQAVGELHRVIKPKPTQEELRRSFTDKLEKGVPAVSLDEVAAYHGKYPRWVLRREAEGAIKRLPGHGRRAMFDRVWPTTALVGAPPTRSSTSGSSTNAR